LTFTNQLQTVDKVLQYVLRIYRNLTSAIQDLARLGCN